MLHLISNDILKLNKDEKKFLPLIDSYFTVKSERNDSVLSRTIPKKLHCSENTDNSYDEL